MAAGNLDIIQCLVDQGANFVDEEGTSVLHFATKQNLEVVKYYLQLGVNINQNGKYGTPLLWAAHYGNIKIVEYLILNNAKVNLESLTSGITPLIVASAWGHFEIVQLLLEKGAAAVVNYNSEDYGNPLFWAAGNGHLNIVEYLIEKKADVNLGTMESGSTPLMIATLQNNFEIIKMLLKNKADANKMTLNGYSALHFACQSGCLEIVQHLIKYKANLNQNAPGLGTPLIFAIIGGHFDVIQCLVLNLADVNVYSTDGCSPLHWATTQTERLDILKYLIKNGAHVNENTVLGSPLHFVALNGDLKMMQILIYHGANVNSVKEENGFSPLHEAVEAGHFEVCKYLIAHGANINTKTKNGHSVYDLAIANGHILLTEFFSINHNF
jgi:ankyrin repeat protein